MRKDTKRRRNDRRAADTLEASQNVDRDLVLSERAAEGEDGEDQRADEEDEFASVEVREPADEQEEAALEGGDARKRRGQSDVDACVILWVRTELKVYAETIHCSLYSTMWRSRPIVGNAIEATVALAVCERSSRQSINGA